MYLLIFINLFFPGLNSPLLCDLYFDLFHMLNKSDNDNNIMSLGYTRMSSLCHSHALVWHSYVTMSSVSHSYVLVCHPCVTRMYSYDIRMSLVCTRISSLCHSHALGCHPYVTFMYSYDIRLALCHPYVTMPSVCHSYVLVCHQYVLICHPYVTGMYSYVIRMSLVCVFTMNHHEPVYLLYIGLLINEPSLENKLQVITIVVEAVNKYEYMNHCKNRSTQKTSIA